MISSQVPTLSTLAAFTLTNEKPLQDFVCEGQLPADCLKYAPSYDVLTIQLKACNIWLEILVSYDGKEYTLRLVKTDHYKIPICDCLTLIGNSELINQTIQAYYALGVEPTVIISDKFQMDYPGIYPNEEIFSAETYHRCFQDRLKWYRESKDWMCVKYIRPKVTSDYLCYYIRLITVRKLRHN